MPSPPKRATEAPMASYLLARHSYVQVLDGQLVFLDLRNSKYLSCKNAGALVESIVGLPGLQVPLSDGDRRAVASACEDFERRGLLTRDMARGKTAEPVRQRQAIQHAYYAWYDVRRRIGVLDVLPFVLAVVEALGWSWGVSVRRTMAILRRRAVAGRRRRQESNLEDIKELTGIFFRIRPLFYTAKERCLFDSIALTNFLNHRGVYPRLVIGVKNQPFQPHFW